VIETSAYLHKGALARDFYVTLKKTRRLGQKRGHCSYQTSTSITIEVVVVVIYIPMIMVMKGRAD
jgi:hypothetical protein